MGFFNRERRLDPLDWRAHPSPESFAIALCVHGIPAEEARRMLRYALGENERLADELRADAEWRAREAELAERTFDSACVAAFKLLSEVGYPSGWSS